MENWIQRACEAADSLLAQALGQPCKIPSRYSRFGCIANPAPRALKLEEAVLERLPESDFFEKVTLENGFFNFHFSFAWYTWVMAEQAPPAHRRFSAPAEMVDFPARVEPWTLSFLQALSPKAGKGSVDLSFAARQDGENPAWLVGYTARRLKALSGRNPVRNTLTEEERWLVRLAAEYPEALTSAKHLARYLSAFAQAVWELSPQRLSEPARQCAAGVLTAGLAHFS